MYDYDINWTIEYFLLLIQTLMISFGIYFISFDELKSKMIGLVLLSTGFFALLIQIMRMFIVTIG